MFPERGRIGRAAGILIMGEKVALIERRRASKLYYVFPGGGIEYWEDPAQAVVREIREELGISVRVKRLVAMVIYNDKPQYFYWLKWLDGQFGTGSGAEMESAADSESGSFTPVWMPVAKLEGLLVYPATIAQLVGEFPEKGWPKETSRFIETRQR
jgi:8-oxo-dGTP diphosphatase